MGSLLEGQRQRNRRLKGRHQSAAGALFSIQAAGVLVTCGSEQAGGLLERWWEAAWAVCMARVCTVYAWHMAAASMAAG